MSCFVIAFPETITLPKYTLSKNQFISVIDSNTFPRAIDILIS
jgi:hypothetical protein